jgi:ribonuclease R
MKSEKILNGIIKRHPDGFGFFIADASVEHPDVFVPANAMKTAMTNDKVSIIAEKERDGRFRGEIVRINERAQKRIAGKFSILNENFGSIKDEGKGWGSDLKIPITKSMSAKVGELVAAIIISYPDSGDFIGEITEVIGDADSALNDVRRVIVNQNIPDVFSEATLTEAATFGKNPIEKDFAGRRDLRGIPIVTIDGATAKDFDDAVFVETKDNGFHLIVAIADVSHYVKSGNPIDTDAYERGTSVYFPNFVVPMIPEALSNGLCSLNPNVPRLALVADMNFDFTGTMMNSGFYEAVIESKARITYGEAQEIVEGHDMIKHTSIPGVQENVLRCADLAKVLMARRFKDGSLDLEVPETELVIDGTGEPIDVIKSERLFAHRLIEEMMLAANVAVAKFLANKEIPSLYRVHESPDPLKISLLEKYLHNLGSTANLAGERLQKKLTRALQEFTNEAQSNIIHILTLRSMSQAKYQIENLGHFGLGFDYYTHFTSPIRRYPDLIIHRLIKTQIAVPGYRLLAEDDIKTAGTWLSACEQRSAKSERQIQSIKKARFMKKFVGETFDGMISSVTKFGVFVLLKQYNVDGLIKLEDLGGQGPSSWEFDEENLKLVSKRSGFSYNLGDVVKVTVSAIDVEQGQINFVLEGQTAVGGVDRKYAKPLGFKSKSKSGKKSDGKFGDKAFGRRDSKEKSDLRTNKQSTKTAAKKDNDRRKEKFKDQSKSKPGKVSAARKEFNSYKEKKFGPQSVSLNTSQLQPVGQTKPSGDAGGGSVIKPRYSSLADYLDKNSKKVEHGNNKTDATTSTKKSTFRTSENRKDVEKRGSTENNSNGVRKTRSEKSRRKNKSR